MGTTQEYKKKIADKLAFLESRIRRYGDLRLYDENIALEDVVCDLLNLICGFSLENMNAQRVNYPAIDLGDRTKRIAVQVTSDGSRKKAETTIQKFNKNAFYNQYDRLLIFVIGGKEKFTMNISGPGLQFHADRDIWDFGTLIKEIDRLEYPQLEKIHAHLEREYPEKKRGRGGLGLVAAVLVLAAVFFWNRQSEPALGEAVPTAPVFSYETDMDWLTMDEVASILSDDSRVEVYSPDLPGDYYYQGAALTVLYSNLSQRDRYITRFSVYAENIQENLSPQLSYYAFTNEGWLTYWCFNEGWGETGDFTMEYLGMRQYESDVGQTCVDVKLREGAVTFWEFESISPGEVRYLTLFSLDDFRVEYRAEFDGIISYEMDFRLYSAETGHEEIIPCLLYVYPDRYEFLIGGSGMGDERNYVVWVETGEPRWQETYTIQQCLPANETVRLPIFIVPEKSCTMTVRIVFETLDGEIIEAAPLENASFYVPYYDDPVAYIDGKLLDWDRIVGNEVIYFPFRQVTSILPPED